MHLLVGGPTGARNMFVACEDYQSLNFLRFLHVLDLVPQCSSDMNERNWIYLLFQFLVLMNVAALFIETGVFNPWCRL